jgi:type IV pilus assembly protein PilN
VILINLLPHREEKRQRRKTAFFAGLGMAAAIGLAAVGSWFLVVDQLKAAQEDRNKFLSAEIAKLDKEIIDLLNELVKQTPEGMYFTGIKQNDQILNIAGIAQTQERVSEFLRNTAYSSEWLVTPELVESKATVVTSATKEQKRLFDFSTKVTVKRPQDKATGSAAIPASAPASAALDPKKV